MEQVVAVQHGLADVQDRQLGFLLTDTPDATMRQER